MNPIEDPANLKAFSERVAGAFRETFGEKDVQILGGKSDVFSVVRGEDSEFVVVTVRFGVRAIRRRILALANEAIRTA